MLSDHAVRGRNCGLKAIERRPELPHRNGVPVDQIRQMSGLNSLRGHGYADTVAGRTMEAL